MHTADVGLADPHWWIEHRGEALDVVYLEQRGLCVSVEDVAEFRKRRNVPFSEELTNLDFTYPHDRLVVHRCRYSKHASCPCDGRKCLT